jgi:hypothetical protein
MLIDTARGLARERDRHQDAIRALMRAEAIAPHHVHADPFARETVASLLFTDGGAELRNLARRAGVA